MSTDSAADADGPGDEIYLEEYLKDAGLQGLEQETLDVYKSNIRGAFEYLEKAPTQIDQYDLRDLLHHLKNERAGRDGTPGVSDSTVNGWFSALNSYYDFLKFEGRVEENPIPDFRERYVNSNTNSAVRERQLISVEEMATLIHATLNVRNRALNLILAKTGLRRNELVAVDLNDIDWEEQSISLEPKKKRSNEYVLFDDECARVLERWLTAREEIDPSTDALFTNQLGKRLKRSGVYRAVTTSAEAVGLHDPDSSDPKERFTPHCHRHWFTTHLRRSGMPRGFIKELRGDTRGEGVDMYDHINKPELRESYLAHIPSLGL